MRVRARPCSSSVGGAARLASSQRRDARGVLALRDARCARLALDLEIGRLARELAGSLVEPRHLLRGDRVGRAAARIARGGLDDHAIGRRGARPIEAGGIDDGPFRRRGGRCRSGCRRLGGRRGTIGGLVGVTRDQEDQHGTAEHASSIGHRRRSTPSRRRIGATARELTLADLRPGQRAAEDRTDPAQVEPAGGQRESAVRHRDHAERVRPEHVANDEKSRAGDQAKPAAGRAVEESREPRSIERISSAHGDHGSGGAESRNRCATRITAEPSAERSAWLRYELPEDRFDDPLPLVEPLSKGARVGMRALHP